MNLLGKEKSPYLLQHKDNPIHWLPWGQEAFLKAEQENKPIFLSIGYSTCHWCHVMAHESFEDQEVAEALNKSFVCIKLDREERPDIDDFYMAALQTLTGGGGWPMSIWMTSEGKPFFAGTYFPKFRFLQLLRRIEQIWTTENEKLLQDGERLLEAVKQATQLTATDAVDAEFEEFLQTYISHFQHHFDDTYGGFGSAPKFPPSMNLMVMMRQDAQTGLHQAEAMVSKTLNAMVKGGIYDHLQGGFHRYSVDEKWLVPHFEKMLYDQAWITMAMLEAYQLYGGEELSLASRETLDFVLRELRSPEGGFYCALDADSKNDGGKMEEGYFCTFSFHELNEALTDEELTILQNAYGVTRNGNFEGRNILSLQEDYDRSVLNDPVLQSAFVKLRKIRAARPQPHLDDKVIVGWNGWMISTLCKAAQTLDQGGGRYLNAAQAAATFIKKNLYSNGQLKRRWRDGEAAISAMAEDYVSLINACIHLYETDLDSQWLDWALELQKTLDAKFWDEEQGGYFSDDGSDKLMIHRGKEDYDGVRPCANSMGALNLLKIYHFTSELRFKQRAEGIFQLLFQKAKSFPSSLPYLSVALDFYIHPAKDIVVAGLEPWTKDFKAELQGTFSPNLTWGRADEKSLVSLLKKPQSTAAIYLCEEGKCQSPALNFESATAALRL